MKMVFLFFILSNRLFLKILFTKEMTEYIKLELAISKEGLKINGINYKVNIQFDNNEIIICDEGLGNSNWFLELLSNPHDFKKYSIEYQGKCFELLPETLLTLIIYRLKKEMNGIIDDFQLIVENDKDELRFSFDEFHFFI